ncbi:MAG: CHASE2 domain-containing protein, partial [Deltaproteobacteria bacterium]|nr:CHASE2 domain-containing protein [Deltaproteobacteria bacterium]
MMMDKPASIFRPSPFKIGCLVVLASCLIFYSFGKDKPALLVSIDNQLTSAMFRWRGADPITGQVIIIDIDEKSLREVGQWPWPRDIVARLVTSINAARPKSIGFDIVFAEKDRTSPSEYVEGLSELISREDIKKELGGIRDMEELNHDLVLGKAIAVAPTVLGFVFQMADDGLKSEDEKPFPSATITISPSGISPRDLFLPSGYRATLNITDIAQAPTEGFMNVFPDSSGMVRKVPLFMSLDGIPYPSLALEMVRTASGSREITIHASSQKTAGRNSVLGVSVGSLYIPTDDKGHVMVNFRGPFKTFEYISAVDILKGSRADRIRG